MTPVGRSIKEVLRDKKLQLLLFIMLVVQVITAVNQPGFFHPDQHFQIVEFSSYQLHRESGATSVWELDAAVRPTLQVYIFSAFVKICEAVGIADPYTQMTLLRLKLSLAMFLVFTFIALYYFKNERKIVLYSVLCLLNLSYFFPYVKTLFSSEIVSSLFFFGAIFWYDLRKNKPNNFFFTLFIGFLLSLSFYFRFQMGLAVAGFGIWMIIEKKWKPLLPLIIGFAIGVGLNTWLDNQFYHHSVFTPYEYFKVNILEGKAASFGTSSFLQYVGVLAGFVSIPPLSLILLILVIRSWIKYYRHPFVLPVAIFIIGHCFIGHKEERFMYPMFFALPIVIGLSLPDFTRFYDRTKRWLRYSIKGIIIFSACLNVLLLVLLMFNAYAQTVYFSQLLKTKFHDQPVTVYCLARTPFQTESGLPLVFYRKSFPNMELKKLSVNDSLRFITGNNLFVATTYNQVKQDKKLLDSLGYKPVLYSSRALWAINEYLDSKKGNTINDIWALYKKE